MTPPDTKGGPTKVESLTAKWNVDTTRRCKTLGKHTCCHGKEPDVVLK